MGRKQKKVRKIGHYENQINYENTFVAESTLDFHDFGILDHFDIEKNLTEFLEDAQIAGLKYVIVVTGKGAVVRPLIKKLLKSHPLVESFQQAGYFTGQSGAFEVTLVD